MRSSSYQDVRDLDESIHGRLGLNVIFCPKSSPTVDIVLIHGLGGTSRKTWSKNGDPDLFWPLKFLPLEPYICLGRIFTFGYNANFRAAGNVSTSILDFAKDLLFDLKFAKDSQKEDLNIGKRSRYLLLQAGHADELQAYMQGQNDPEYESIVKAISAIMFLATPHRGTNLADLLDRILRSTLATNSKNYISELGKKAFTLQKLNEQFRHIAPRLDIVSFYETQSTSMILEKDSSILGYPGEKSRALDADHHNVCKYDSPSDPNYVAVRNALQSLVGKIASKNGQNDDSSSARNKMGSLKSSLGITELPDTDYIFFRDQWSQGTCDWLLGTEDYLEWLHPPSKKSSLAWLSGGAAAGKSILSSFIINDLAEKGLCCQYFFLRFGDRRKRTLSLLLRSIAFQVALSKATVLERILQLGEQGIDSETASPRTIWERIFKAIIFKLQENEPMYWVIDGLDEADDPRSIVRLLSEVSVSSVPIRMLLVSRETSEIAASLQKKPPGLDLRFMSIEGHKEDFSHYIQQELSLFGDEQFREDVVRIIVKESQNNFLWVRLAVETLNLCHSKKHVELALHQLPIGMQAFYDRMALSIAQQTDSVQRALASAVLQYVTTSLHVLSVAELSQALHEEASELLDMQRSIIDVCCGFIVINKDGYVAMVHQTAREYLLNGVDRPFNVDRSAAHKKMFLTCMRCLFAVGLRPKVDGKQNLVFLNYAACSWPMHLLATSAEDEEVADILHKFLAGRWILSWIQVLANTGQLRVLIQASRHLSKYLGKRRSNDEVCDQRQYTVKQELVKLWAEDLAKIVGKFGGILGQNPESIHKLIPPFCPQNSAIYQQFGKPKGDSLVVTGFPSHNWDDSLARLSFGLGTYATSVSAVGAQIATLVPSGTVLLHDSSNFEETEASPIRHGERVYSMVSNSSATLLATYGYHTIKFWDTHSGKWKLSVDNLQSRPRPLAMLFLENDQSLLIGSDDRRVRSLDLNPESPSWQTLAELEEPELEGHFLNSPSHMAVNQDGKLISVAYRGHPLSAWEIDGPVHIGHCWRTRDVLARGEVIEAVWHPHQPEILGLYIEGVIFKWRPYDDETEEFAAGASRLAMSADGSLVVTGDVRGTVKVFTTADLTNLYQLASEDNVLGLAFSPDLRRFYDVRGNYGNVWEPNALLKFVEQQNKDTEIGSEIGSLSQTSDYPEGVLWRVDSITSLAASPTGQFYCFGTEKGAAHVYDRQRGKVADLYVSRSFLSIEHMVWSHDGHYVCFSDSSKRIFVSTINPKVNNCDAFVQMKVQISVKTIIDGPITQLLFHPDSTQIMICSPSSICTVSLASASVAGSAKIAIAGSRWIIHAQDPTLIVCVGPEDIHILDWGLSLRQTFKIERVLDQSRLPPLQDKGEVVEILCAANKKLMLLQIERRKENIFLLLAGLPDHAAVDEADHASTERKLSSLEFRPPVSSQIILALDLLSSDHLIFLSRDFSICSVRLPIQYDLSMSSLTISIQGDSESAAQHKSTNTVKPPEAAVLKTWGLEKPEPLFWLPRDWISRDCLALCKIWRKERSLLCPRNGAVAVVRCAKIM
ncbi:uncharacterized protein KY384_004396 [Bacidia gigantensis]|uniref:uncharacterized protein n=1 Tax=Bacidia gigantensis TaxID=2732470 RepID=UPI001D03636C|nr:uncharacterized protein KY384_004396 [Bacidia gigantensis]KAG8531039.1 hypothetical protein KY384_004396 [Bacidia gigantensis]